MKRMISLMLSAAMVLVMATGCANPGTPSSGDDKSTTSALLQMLPAIPMLRRVGPTRRSTSI